MNSAPRSDWFFKSSPSLARCLSPAIRLLALCSLNFWNDFLPKIWVVILQILAVLLSDTVLCNHVWVTLPRSPWQPRAYNVLIYFHHGNHSSFNIFTFSVIMQPNLDALLMLNASVAAACNFWPLAAKASQLSFTNKLVDEATAESGADEEFHGFHDNAGLMLIFFLQRLPSSSAWEAHHDHPGLAASRSV